MDNTTEAIMNRFQLQADKQNRPVNNLWSKIIAYVSRINNLMGLFMKKQVIKKLLGVLQIKMCLLSNISWGKGKVQF